MAPAIVANKCPSAKVRKWLLKMLAALQVMASAAARARYGGALRHQRPKNHGKRARRMLEGLAQAKAKIWQAQTRQERHQHRHIGDWRRVHQPNTGGDGTDTGYAQGQRALDQRSVCAHAQGHIW